MVTPRRARRRILCSANNGVNVVMYKPIADRLRSDRRLKVFHTGSLSHTRRIQEMDRRDLRTFFRRQGIDEGVLHYRVARFVPWDVYLSANFSKRIMPRFARVKVQVFHGVSFKNCAVTPKAKLFDRLFLPGPYHRRRFLEQGHYQEGDPALMMVGLPKVDRLVDGSLQRDRVLLDLELDPAVKTVLYAPTGDANNSLHKAGQEIIDTLLQLPLQLIVKPHDHAAEDQSCAVNWLEKLAHWKHPRLRAILHSDVVPALAAADLLLTDASSVAFEYTLLDRPIVFFDVPEILTATRKSKMDLQTWGRRGGDIIHEPRELAELVLRLLDDPSEKSEVRRAIAQDLFHEPGHATARAVRCLYDLLELEAPAPYREVAAAAAG